MTEREKDIAKMYRHRYNMREIGDKYGLSRQRIHQILRKLDKQGVKTRRFSYPQVGISPLDAGKGKE